MARAVALLACIAYVASDNSYFTINSRGGLPIGSYFALPQSFPDPGWRYKQWPADFTQDGVSLVRVRATYPCGTALLSEPISFFQDQSDLSAYYSLDSGDLGLAAGKVALVEGITCQGMTWQTNEYMYWKLMSELNDAGVTGVIYGEPWLGKLPEMMLPACTSHQDGSACLRIPVAHVVKADMSSILAAMGSEASIMADFSNMRVYRQVDEPQLFPSHSPLKLDQSVPGGTDINFLPGVTSSFNPDSEEATLDIAVAEWAPECLVENYTQCVACWQLPSPLSNSGALQGKAVVFHASTSLPFGKLFRDFNEMNAWGGGQSCYGLPSHFAAIAQRAGAKGAIMDTGNVHLWAAGGPYISPAVDIQITMWVVDKVSADSMDRAIVLAGVEGTKVTLPAVHEHVGPPFYAQSQSFAYAQVGVWSNAANHNNPDAPADKAYNHFDCLALETQYNPVNNSGFDPPLLEAGTGTVLVHARPSDACAALDTCSQCMLSDSQLDFNHEGKVVLLMEGDFVCFHHRYQYTQAAERAGAVGVVLGLGSDLTVGLVDGIYSAAIPTFLVDEDCGERIRADDDDLFVSFPETLNGDPVFTDWNSQLMQAEDEELTFVKVTGDIADDYGNVQGSNLTEFLGDITGLITAGQSNNNPKNYPTRQEALVVAEVHPDCSVELFFNSATREYEPVNGDSCVKCDLLSVDQKYLTNLSSVEGRAVLFPADFLQKVETSPGGDLVYHTLEQGHCMMPWSNVVRHMAGRGAVAVVFANGFDEVVTMSQQGLPDPLPIPSFNIRRTDGIKLQGGLLQGDVLEAHTPRLDARGSAYQGDPYEIFTEVDPSRFLELGARDTTPSSGGGGSNAGLIAGLVVGCVMGIVLGVVGYKYWRRKYVFAYNQLDRAMQTGDGWVNPFDEDHLAEEDPMEMHDVDHEVLGGLGPGTIVERYQTLRDEGAGGGGGGGDGEGGVVAGANGALGIGSPTTPARTPSSFHVEQPSPAMSSGIKSAGKGMIVHNNSAFDP